jgi:peptidoglycan hydrolase-like protein with peptidoglycan-binding domain
MKKFFDKTKNGKEKAIKKLTNLPVSGISSSLGWHSSKQISPSNSLVITDLSSSIPENTNPSIFSSSGSGSKVFYSNELGVLQDINGVSLINGDEISVSDLMISKEYVDIKLNQNSIDPNDFAHSYYISKDYVLLEQDLFKSLDLDSFIEPYRLPMSIKVVDSSGEEYIDKSTRQNKYRILLDPLEIDGLNRLRMRPYSIVVLLKDYDPNGLYLMYDKVSIISQTSISSIEYKHREYINPIPIFSKVSEESLVADRSSIFKRIYAQKPTGFSEQISNQQNNNNDGFEVFVPRKALPDNRTYETFNWRLIAKINKNVQTSSINYGDEIDTEGNIRQKVIRCAVLTTAAEISSFRSSNNYGSSNPYVFSRLENSPFNLSAYRFENPNAPTTLTKNNAEYWLVDIDTVNVDNYDILAWSPTSRITESQGAKVRYFIEQKNGTMVLDLSSQSLLPNAATAIYPYLSISEGVIPLNNWTYNVDNIYNNELKTNAWPISDSVFEAVNDKVVYGVFGNSITSVSNTPKNIKHFDASLLSPANIMLSETSSGSKPIFLGIEHRPSANALVRGSLLVTCSPLMKYCNDIYQASSLFNQAASNSGPIKVEESSVQPTAVIEGPFKVLYNATSVALLSKIQSSKVLDLRSSTYYVTGNWNSSYLLNGSVLLDEELSEYSQIPDSNYSDARKSCKNLTSSYGSILDYYRRIAYDAIPDQYSILLQDIDTSNLEIYIEITNRDVVLANLSLISNNYLTGNLNDIPSSHILYKVLPTQYSSNAYAYTNSNSLPFVVPGGFGPHTIKEVPLAHNDQLSQSAFTSSLTSSSYKSYPFDFEIFSSYSQSSEVPSSFDVTWSAPMTASGTATLNRKKRIQISQATRLQENDVRPTKGYSAVDVDDNSIFDKMEKYARITHVRNNFFYSGDIDAGNSAAQYKNGSSGDYVRYIQYTLAYSGINEIKNIAIDGSFGPQTESFIRIFQQKKKLTWVDGVVDSQTKSYLIRVWKQIAKDSQSNFDKIFAKIKKAHPNVTKFIEQYANPEINQLHSSDLDYRRISFTGTASGGPQGIIKDIVFVRVPEKFNTKKEENLISNVVINSIKIVPGSFANARQYKGIKISKIICGTSVDDDKINSGKLKIIGSATAGQFTKNPIVQSTSGISGDNAIWFAIEVEGAALGGKFGDQAEGYSINDISFDISYTYGVDNFTLESEPVQTLPFSMQFNISGTVNGVNTNTSKKIDFTGRSSTSYTPVPVSVTYPTYYEGNRTEPLSSSSVLNFSSTDYKPPFTTLNGDVYEEESVSLNLSTMTYSVGQVSINTITSNGNPLASNYVSVDQLPSSVTFSTAALVYQNLTRKTDPVPIVDYWLLRQDNSLIRNAKKTVTVLDGLVLLTLPTTDPSRAGKPTGVNPLSIPVSPQLNEEINIDYGALVLKNNVESDAGVIWGFYDNNTKEFLGSILHYIDYVNRGQNNIYIGVMAFDADGSIASSVDFIGPTNANMTLPVRIPMKMAYPIYCINYQNSTKIRVLSESPDRSKFEQWPLYISSGSFVKDFTISPSYGWVNWLSKYRSKKIRATYSTLNLGNIPWSIFLGRPYIDIKNEKPKIISSKAIQLSNKSLVKLVEPSYTYMGKITYVIDIYTRTNEQSDWVSVSKNLIKSINTHSGLIEFSSSIVPKDNSNIYVDYSVKSNGLPVKHVNGSPIPLNPFLNKDLVEFNKPLYIYLNPIKLEVQGSSINQTGFFPVEEYAPSNAINFTYDSALFDVYDSVKYDPFAIPIATINIVNHFDANEIQIEDLRLRGGGVLSSQIFTDGSYGNVNIAEIQKVIPEALSFWDVYPPLQQAYPKGGFVIIKIPREVLNNFENAEEVYSIIDRNITAGVSYRLQDMEGNDWGVK